MELTHNNVIYWSARRCEDYLRDRGIWVGGWPEDCESSLDCQATLRAACANLASGQDPETIARYIRGSSTLDAGLIENSPTEDPEPFCESTGPMA